MRVRSLHMSRRGDWGSDTQRIDYSKPFDTVVKLEGDGNKIELQIPPEVSEKIMALIAEEVSAAAKKAAEALTFSAFVVEALPAPAPQLPPEVESDHIPF